jgi:isoleucyl-tRNA synthetase
VKYNEYKQLDYANLAEEVRAYWKQNRIFEKSVETREGQESFVFYEGPPSANGAPGIHHVMARAVKDIFCRYKTLQGFQVQRKGGWDTHGLPIELQVEKELGITKEDIGKTISVEEYNARCRETVMRFKDQWDDLTERMGYWVDLDNPYITFDNKYIESNWALLKKLYDKGYLYKGYTIQPFSPAAGTGLSSHELNQPGTYRNVKDTSIVAQFKIQQSEKADFLFQDSQDNYFLAWTTTPWTLPANTALAVGKNIKYVQVKTFNPYTFAPITVVLAKDLVGKYFSEKAKEASFEDYQPGDKVIPFHILQEFTGEQIKDVTYEQLMPYVQPDKPAFRVVIGDFVTTEDGTGIVHISPTFGADDFRVAAQNDIPALLVTDENGKPAPIVNRQGRFVQEITDFAGMPVKNYDKLDETSKDYKSTDVLISIKLKEEGKAFKVEKYEHSYPHCWRTDMPILYYPLDSWFIQTTAVKARLIELNKTINWKPESTGAGRFGNWLENLVDWNLSRSRYWGTPLPIWRTEDGAEEICIGSVAQLDKEIERSIQLGFMQENPLRKGKPAPKPVHTGTKNEHAANNMFEFAGEFALSPTGTEEPREEFVLTDIDYNGFDLHRPYVDNIILVSAKGEPMQRETDLIDVWFDSGAMPYAQWHYPFENHDKFKANFPADFIAEGVDQTRGWFFTLHALAVMLEDSVAFKNVIANGLVLDKNGNKMSKRLGNAIDPFETIGRFGPDATRWYMIVNAPPWDNLKFNLDGVTEVQRRFFGTLQNTYSFFALYANLDGFTFQEGEEVPLSQRTESDRWIISRLNTLVREVEGFFDDYDPTKAARAIQDFVADELSNWYVRLNRKRFWKGELNQDKQAAYQTLYTCLETVAKLGAPIAPFYMDRLFLDLNRVSGRSLSESVHLERFPLVNENLVDVDLEERMQLAQSVSSLVHSLRKKQMIKVRQPLSRILVPILDDKMKTQLQAVEDLILSEVNVKSLEYLEDTTGILVKKIKPNFKRLGQVFGPKLKIVAAQIQEMGQEDITRMEREGFFEIAVDGDTTVLSREDVEIMSEDIPGWLVASEGTITVALDITLTEELRLEGMARELVNRLQNLRKDSGLEVQDKIRVFIQDGQEEVRAALQLFGNYIAEEVQAVDLTLVPTLAEGDATVLDMEGISLPVRIEVAR